MRDYAWIKEDVRKRFMERASLKGEMSDDEALEEIKQVAFDTPFIATLSIDDRTKLVREIFSSVRKLDVLQNLLDDPEITEVMINGTDPVFIEKKGR